MSGASHFTIEKKQTKEKEGSMLAMVYQKQASWLFVMLLSVMFISTGCGKQSTTVSGSVTYNGKPVEKGSISFRTPDGRGPSFAAKIREGRYSTDKAVPGPRTVVVIGVKKINFHKSSADAYKAAATRKPGSPDVGEAADYIAENAEGNSQVHEIAAGDQTLDFNLTGKPRS